MQQLFEEKQVISGRVPPQDINAEVAILGTCLFGTEHYLEAIESVKSKHFYNNNHRIIFEEVERIASEGGNIDIVTVANGLKERGALETVGGIQYLSGLTSDIMPGFVGDYCRIVKNLSMSRQVIQSSSDILAKAFDGAPHSEIVSSVNDMAMSLHVDDKTKAIPISDLIPETLTEIERWQNMEERPGIPSGLTDLDNHTGGFKKSNLIIVAGRPGMGKTSFALKILRSAGQAGKRCSVFSLEMKKSRLVTRMISSETMIPSTNMERGFLNSADWPKITAAAERIKGYDITIDDSTALTVAEISSRAKMQAIKKPIDLLVIDYIQLIKGTGGETRAAELTKISRSLLALAKDLDCALVVLAQLNRECEKRTNQRPVVSDLKESGAMEEDADMVILLYRDEVYNTSPDNPEKGIAEIIIGKGRDIGQRTVKSAFVGNVAGFEDLSVGSF